MTKRPLSLAVEVPGPHLRSSPQMEHQAAPRQIKMPVKINSDTEAEEIFSNASGLRAADICSKLIGRLRVPTRHPRPLNQRRWRSRQNIRSFKCRFMIASRTRIGWSNYREPLRELSDANGTACHTSETIHVSRY